MDQLKTEKENLINLSHKEIIVSLTDVVNKIVSLHECSNEDFLMFNGYLKDYSRVSEKISGNVKTIIKTYSGEQNKETFEKITSFISYLLGQIKKMDDAVAEAPKILKKMLFNIDLLIIPLKNFNLNLLTLKFLNSNLFFNISKDKVFQNENPELIKAIEGFKSLVDSIKLIYPELDIQIFRLRQLVKSTLAQLIDIKEYSESTITPENEEINKTIKYLQSKSDIIISQFPNLNGITQNRFDGIGNIITNLQYHDIIRQKMNHIQESHIEIINELEEIEKSGNGEIHEDEKKIFYIRVKNIIGLQVAQLIHTNKQYQTAIEIITRKFLEIGSEFASLSALSKQFSLNLSQDVRVSFFDLDEMLQKKIRTKDEFEKNISEVFSACKQIIDKIKKLSKTISQISDFDEKIKTVLNGAILKSETGKKRRVYLSESLRKIRVLTDDIHFGVVNVNNYFKEILLLEENLSFKNNQNIISESPDDKINVDEISKQLNILKDNEMGVRHHFIENKKICNDFSIKLNASIEHVRYYDLFEKISEDILGNLANVHNQLDVEVEEEHNKMFLDKIADKYTTESQREIHNKFLGKNNLDNKDIDDTDDENTGELELF